jgi:ArsR family transcriptional regulator
VDLTQNLVEALRGLGDPTRLKVTRLLLSRELCVCQLVEVLRLPQPTVSQHLGKLRSLRLVRERKEAQWVYYSADREAVEDLLSKLQGFLLGDPSQALGLQEELRRAEDQPTCEELRASRQTLDMRSEAR